MFEGWKITNLTREQFRGVWDELQNTKAIDDSVHDDIESFWMWLITSSTVGTVKESK